MEQQQEEKERHYSQIYGWMDVVSVMTDGTISVIECRTWNNEIVCVSVPDPSFKKEEKLPTA